VHNSFINYYLINWILFSDSVIKFKSFNKLLLSNSVALVSFEEGSATSSSLDNFHSEMLDVIIVHCFVVSSVCRLKVRITSHIDRAFRSLFIFFFIVLSGKLKESSRRFLF
jgi:hypothetical protein